MYLFAPNHCECSIVFDANHLTEEQKATGIEVDTLPEKPVEKDGFRSGLFNKDGVATWEYVSIADQIKDAVQEAEDAMMLELIEGGII